MCASLSPFSFPFSNPFPLFLLFFFPSFRCFLFVSQNFSYVTDLDLGTNCLVSLPESFGQLENLVRLNLERNRLNVLPESFLLLKSLKVLKLNKNNFKLVHKFIGRIKFLEHLDLSNNVLGILPPTLPLLKSLSYLDISGNGLAHLAIQPVMQEYEDRIKQQKNKATMKANSGGGVWDTVVDRKTGHTCYYNKRTEKASNTKPIELTLGGETDSLGSIPPRLDRFIDPLTDPKDYLERKKLLATQGVSEWNLDMDTSSGQIFYTNSVSNVVTYDLPDVLDSIGGMVSIRTFKANQNLIRSLPLSMGRCVRRAARAALYIATRALCRSSRFLTFVFGAVVSLP